MATKIQLFLSVLSIMSLLIVGIHAAITAWTAPVSIVIKEASPYLTDFVQLTANPQKDFFPSWSPDGLTIAWFAFDSSEWYRHIWVMDSDGSNKKQLTFGNVVDEGGDWSPDETQIVFTRWGLRGDRFDLMMMSPDGSNIRQITSTGLTHQEPHWSNNGSRIAFSYGGAGTPFEIHVINPDGTNEITLIQNAWHATWSPDDSQLVVDRADGIWLVSAFPPYEARRIYATTEPWTYPQFSPDGKYIIFRMSGDLHLMDSDGKYIVFSSRKSGNYDIWKVKIIT